MPLAPIAPSAMNSNASQQQQQQQAAKMAHLWWAQHQLPGSQPVQLAGHLTQPRQQQQHTSPPQSQHQLDGYHTMMHFSAWSAAHSPADSAAGSSAAHAQSQPQSQRQNVYNSSDYSLYHIYDHICDLSIIKEQRMEHKLAQRRRRRLVGLGALAATLLATLLLAAYQALLRPPSDLQLAQSSFQLEQDALAALNQQLNLQQAFRPAANRQQPPSLISPPLVSPPLVGGHNLSDAPAVLAPQPPSSVWQHKHHQQHHQQHPHPHPHQHPNQHPKQQHPAEHPSQPASTSTTSTTSRPASQAAPARHPPASVVVRPTPRPLVERICDDGLDNDRDGLIDCADSECCSDRACQNNTLCVKSPEPLDILMRKQPPPPTSSFFQRMQFLIYSLQTYANPQDFEHSSASSHLSLRASVIRGRVTFMRQGVTGVRVSIAEQSNLGVTFTRDGGHFDLMVNGGAVLNIEFRREPFAVARQAVRVPWNEIVLVEPVELSLEADQMTAAKQQDADEPDSPVCGAHNSAIMRPQLQTGPQLAQDAPGSAVVEAPAQVDELAGARINKLAETVQHSIKLLTNDTANHNIELVYASSRSNEFMSIVHMQLIPAELEQLPQELRHVHIRVVVEGNLFEQLVEAQPNLTFTYAWNRRNVYKQKCFGVSPAQVSIGYEYVDCGRVQWSHHRVALAGHDLAISDLSGQTWNLNMHHRYNHRDAILQRGDARPNYHLKSDPQRLRVRPLLGDGSPRPAGQQVAASASLSSSSTLSPEFVNVVAPSSLPASQQQLLRPHSLTVGADGSLYVLDYNQIRVVEPPQSGSSSPLPPTGLGAKRGQHQAQAKVLFELPLSRVSSAGRAVLVMHPIEQRLYLTDSDRNQIYAIQPPSSGANETAEDASTASLHVVVGSGKQCAPGDHQQCGDGLPARQARLAEPKAIAFDLSGQMFIADGQTVRAVSPRSGRIYTLLGNQHQETPSAAGQQQESRFPCEYGASLAAHKFRPRSPLDLAVNPLDDTLHLLDDNVVFKLTADKRVVVVAGRPAHCPATPRGSTRKRPGQILASEMLLQSAQSIAFNANGQLFVAEDEPHSDLQRVLLVDTDTDQVVVYAGTNLQQQGQQQQQQQSTASSNSIKTPGFGQNQDSEPASSYKFQSIGAIALDQHNRLVVADRLGLRVLAVEHDVPQLNQDDEFELVAPDEPTELLVFNRFGHHVATRHLPANAAHHLAPSSSRQSPLPSGHHHAAGLTKFTFAYSMNTPFGQLVSVNMGPSLASRMSIYREGPQHHVKMIEFTSGGQCKLEVAPKSGQLQSVHVLSPAALAGKTSLAYHSADGSALLKSSRLQAPAGRESLLKFHYDEHGRAAAIELISNRPPLDVQCRLGDSGGPCQALVV